MVTAPVPFNGVGFLIRLMKRMLPGDEAENVLELWESEGKPLCGYSAKIDAFVYTYRTRESPPSSPISIPDSFCYLPTQWFSTSYVILSFRKP